MWITLFGCQARRGEPPPPFPPDSNFVLSVSEAVADPARDLPSYAKVFIDSAETGRTPSAPRSEEKFWGIRLEPGNHLFRFEYWMAVSSAPELAMSTEAWKPLGSQWQPIERFIRIEPGQRVIVTLKFFEDALRHSQQMSRQPLRNISENRLSNP
ncbi:MAG: hypothetical protein HY549_05270 [Elusimicrobia bacterium]|nr:hypothetical protein [Elusimicrobiota bacterium]